MAVNSETEINLKTLQRVDSNIVQIIDNASQVAIYKYERKLNKWEGTDIEGTLFLYKRSLYPFHGFIIVNRMSTTNFVESITSDMEFVLQEPYFLYKKSCGDIIGSWFYEHRDFRRITNKIQSIVLKQSPTPRRQRCSSDSESCLKKDDAVQDIMTLLSEAHNEYVNIEPTIVERNVEEDFNDLNTYIEKKINNKSFITSEKKVKNTCLRSSSEEKYPGSPRRRFLSTGSYDSSYSRQLLPNKVLNMLVANSNKSNISSNFGNVETVQDKLIPLDDAGAFPFQSQNLENVSAVGKQSSHCSQKKITESSFSGINIFEKSQDFKVPHKMSLKKPVFSNTVEETASSDCIPKMMNGNKTDYSLHSSDLKQSLISHIENDSDIMLKIHEAYAASLKSFFTQKKN